MDSLFAIAKMKCGNWINVVDYTFLVFALIFSSSALLFFASISKLTFGIIVSPGLPLIYILCKLIHCYKSNPEVNDTLSICISSWFSNVILSWLSDCILSCIRFWSSCVLGLMYFVDISGIQNDSIISAITWMLLISIGIKAISSLMQRCLGLIKHTARPVALAEALELVGFSVTGFIFLPQYQAFLFLFFSFKIWVFFVCHIVALRLVPFKYEPLAFLYVLIAISFNRTFGLLDATLCCFAYRLLIDPVLDLLFRKPSDLSSIEGPSEVVINP